MVPYQFDENAKYLLWGCGEFGNSFYYLFRERVQITGYIDSDNQKWGGVMNGLPILAPHDVTGEEKVIVTSSWYRDISKALREKGFTEGITFFSFFHFMVQYMYQKEHVIYIPSTALVITEKCSLRCKYCSAGVPYISHPVDYAPEELLGALERFFVRGGKIGRLLLTGGDAFCHPQLAEVLERIGSQYMGRGIERIYVAGNAMIKPKEHMVHLLKKYEVTVRITDYRESTDLQKVDEIMGMLKNAGVPVELIDQEQWLKVDRDEADYIKDAAGRKAMYQLCQYMGSSLIKNGKFYSCCLAGYRNDKVSIDLRQLDKYQDEDVVRFILEGPSESGYEFCSKCYGMTNSNSHYIAKGEQLQRDS